MLNRSIISGLAALAGLLPLAQAQTAPATAVIEAREVDVTYPAEATVEAVRQATVAAQVAGRVVDVRVDAGQRVKAGELLMRLDAREAAENLAGAQAQAVKAKADLERSRGLFAKKFISQAALDKAEADYKAAAAQAGAAGAGLSHGSVTAPISGIVGERLAELGEMAALGRPLFSVFDPKSLRVVASVPQYKLAEVRQARKARVEFPETGQWVEAVRVELLPSADIHTHTVTARLYLPENAAGVVPGMAARAHFVTGRGKKLTVPPAAVLRRGEVTAVYVLDAQNQARLRQVRLGEPVAGGALEVMAGLAPGDKVSLEPVNTGIALKQSPAK